MKKIVVLSLLLFFTTTSVFALYGTRPRGMGNAFTAVANDAAAVFWNPAGLALNPEVAATGSTLLTNRNLRVGDNSVAIKLCYETQMNPFAWIAGVGLASAFAFQGAQYLSDHGIVKTGWGRPGEKTSRDESMADQVKGSEEVVSLKELVKEPLKQLGSDVADQSRQAAKEMGKEAARITTRAALLPWQPWYYSNSYYPPPRTYWGPPPPTDQTKAQFALGLGWLNDYNPPLDQKTNFFTLGVASGFEERIAVGATLNLYDLTKISTDIRGIGADLDLGVIARPVDYISLGLATKGILTTDIHWQSGDTSRYEMLVNVGVAVKPLPALTLAADAHNILRQNNRSTTLHCGVEALLIPGLAARAGLDDGNKTAGLSLLLDRLTIDYSILGGVYGRTQMIGGSWRF